MRWANGDIVLAMGEFIQLDAPRKMVQTRNFEPPQPPWKGETTLTFHLEPIDGGTRVTLPDEGFAGRPAACEFNASHWEVVGAGLAVACGGVELGHELAVGGAGGGEFIVAFFHLDPQVGDLLLEVGGFLAERVDVGGGAEPGFPPGLLAERLGEAFSELLDMGVESSPAVAQLDLAYHDVNRGRGGYYLLQRTGAVERTVRDIDIFEAKTVPPAPGRCRQAG